MGTKAKFKVVDRDKGWAALLRRMDEAKGASVKVGVLGKRAIEDHGADDYGGRLTTGDLAVIHEFGAPAVGIPARSFIRAPFDANRQQYLLMYRGLLQKFYAGKMPLPQVLGLMGAKMSADFKRYVTSNNIKPGLSPATIRRKEKLGRGPGGGGVRALIDTGRMIGAISWQVTTKATGTKEP